MLDSSRLRSVRDQPTTYENVHESVFRSYHALNAVKDMLLAGWPAEVILVHIDDFRESPNVAYKPEHVSAMRNAKGWVMDVEAAS